MGKAYDMSADFEYYVKHQSELVSEYDGQYVVIADQKLLGAYKTMGEALEETLKTRRVGEFFLHQVGEGKENYSTVTSRVGAYV